MKYFIKLIVCFVFLQSCAAARIYELNCVDVASSAGHTYERMFGGKALVAVGKKDNKLHAQAYYVENDEMVWLTVTFSDHGCRIKHILVVDAYSELREIYHKLSLEDFDKRYGH